MKRVSSVKKVVIFTLLAVAATVSLIFLGRYISGLDTNFGVMIPETADIIGAGLIQIGTVSVYISVAVGFLTIISRSRVCDIPEYSKLLDGVSENRKLRRKMNRALLCYDRKKYNKAIEKLESLIGKCKTEKEKCSVYTLMGMCHAAEMHHDKAVEAYTAAVKADSSDPALLEKLGQQQNAAGMHSEAVESWLREAELSGSERPFTDIARVYLNEKNYDGTIEYAEKALEINERCGEAYKMLCLVYYALGDKENCLKNYNLCNTYGKNTAELKEAEKWLGKEKYDPYAEYLS